MRLVVFLFLLMFSVSTVVQAASPVIKVREFNIVKAGQSSLSLGDIASFSGFQTADSNRLSSLPIGNAPRESETREFTSFALSEILRAQLTSVEAHYNDKVQLSIPRTVHVEVDSKRLTPRKAQREIEKFYQSSCGRCEVVVSNVKISVGEFPTDWSIDFKSEMPRGPFTLPVRVNNTATVWVSGKLSVFRVVPVASRALNAGENIQPSDIMEQRRDVTFSSDSVPTQAELVGSTLARTLMANQILWKNSLVKTKALNRGDVIKIITGSEAWQVSVSGVAQQAGYIGDAVQVLNPSTQKTLTAVVVEKGVVKVQ